MLLSDPLASPLLAPLGLTLAGLLGSSLVALRVAVRGQLSTSSLFVRWRTWLVIAPLFSLIVLAGPLPLAVFAAALAVQGSREYAALAGLTSADRRLLTAAAVVSPAVCLFAPLGVSALVLLPLLASVPALLSQDAERGLARLSRLTFGALYVPLPLSLLVVLDQLPGAGPGLVLGVALAVALSDVGAFAAGRLVGRKQLAPRLSPSKTWAGLLGNLAGAWLGLLLLGHVLPARIGSSLPLLALVVAVGAVWGDLLESLLKRGAGVKDSAAWLPGFGGLLDRLDSLLVVLPLVYAVVAVLA